jgi:two-component SAPR family response regulator
MATAPADGEHAAATEPNGSPAAPNDTPAAEPHQPALFLRCFGPRFEVCAGERLLTPDDGRVRHAKPWGILAYLAAQPTGEANREKLIEAFWPDDNPAETINRLNTNLMRVRKLLRAQLPGLAGDIVRADSSDGTVRLDTDVAVSDVHEFVRLCTAGPALPRAEQCAAYARAHALYRGDLLSEAGAGYDWVHERGESGGPTPQEQFREAHKRLTKELARLCLEDGDPQRAAELCKDLLRSEPLLEDVIQILYRCYGALGDLVSLEREHRRLLQALRDAEETTTGEPEPVTIRTYEEVRAALASRADRCVADAA